MSHTLNCTGILFDVLYSVFNFQVPRLFHCMTFDTFSFFPTILCSYDETFTQTEGNEEFISNFMVLYKENTFRKRVHAFHRGKLFG